MLVQLHCENTKTREVRFVHQDTAEVETEKITIPRALVETMLKTPIEKNEQWVLFTQGHPHFLLQEADPA